MAPEQPVEEQLDRLLVADVERFALERAGEPGREPGRLGERLLAPAAADHDGAEPRQLERGLAAEPAAGAGDEADLSLQQAVPEDARIAAFTHPKHPICG